jgi:hypothetical protein
VGREAGLDCGFNLIKFKEFYAIFMREALECGLILL